MYAQARVAALAQVRVAKEMEEVELLTQLAELEEVEPDYLKPEAVESHELKIKEIEKQLRIVKRQLVALDGGISTTVPLAQSEVRVAKGYARG